MSLLLKFLPASRRQEGSDDAASVVPEEHVDVKQEKSAGIVSEVHQVEGLDSSGSSSEERAYCLQILEGPAGLTLRWQLRPGGWADISACSAAHFSCKFSDEFSRCGCQR